MGLINKKIIGVKITVSSKDIILEEVRKYLKKVKSHPDSIGTKVKKPLVIFTPNPEIVEFAQKDSNFRQIVNKAQINIPDGQGICWATKKLHRMKISRISGTDFMLDLCKMAEKEGLGIGLIGGREAVALACLECLKKRLPELKGWAIDGPEIEIQNSKLRIQNYRGNSEGVKDTSGVAEWFTLKGIPPRWRNQKESYLSSFVRKIINDKTDILFVALGHPKQEYFINYLKHQTSGIKHDKPLVVMGVGGAFDYISGRVSRAPVWMRESGLEWLYRLIREPGRWKRQLSGLQFFLKVFFK